MEQEWTSYPVVLIDLSASKYYRLKNLHAALNGILSEYEKIYGIAVNPDYADVYSERLKNIILKAAQQTGKQVVVLVDEYDAPMHDSMKDETLQ